MLEASTSREALDVTLNGSVPDVMLLDAQLAIPSAAETCRQLRAQKSMTQPDIWLLAPAGTSTPVIEALEAGADDFLGLPVVPHLLEARLRVTLRRRQRANSTSRLHEALLGAQAEGTGELVVRETGSARAGRVYFYGGRVVWVHLLGETSALNEVLAGAATLDERSERAILDAGRQGTPLSVALEHAGIIDRARWRSCVQAWSRQRLQAIARFAPASSVFMPHEFRLQDDISFTVSELLGDLDGAEDAIELASTLASDGYAGVLVSPERPEPDVETVLSACMASGLVQSVAVLERGTGQCLGARGETLDALAVWTNLNHVNAIVAREGFDSFAVTTKLEHQLTVPLSGQPGWVVHASYSRSRGPLGVAFTDLRFALSQLSQRSLQA